MKLAPVFRKKRRGLYLFEAVTPAHHRGKGGAWQVMAC